MDYSIIPFLQVRESSESLRLDAEYFQVEKLLEKIRRLKIIKLSNASSWITQGPNPVFTNEGMPCLTGRNIANGELDFDGSDIVDQKEFQKLNRFQLKKNDLLITLKGAGSTGKVAIYNTTQEAIFSRNLGLIRLSDASFSLVVFAYLASCYGQKIIDRGVTGGTGQLTLPTTYLKDLDIPKFNDAFCRTLNNIIKLHFRNLEASQKLYKQAEKILLSELELLNWKPKHCLSFIKKFSETHASGRIDAEYFQPMYDEIVERIKQYKKGYKSLNEIVKVKDNNFQPKDDVTYRYIELANISANGNINEFIEALGKDLPTRARRKVKAGDVIVSTIEGSLSSIALITDDLDNALCSTGFFVINSEKINSETLLILLKSLVGQLQLKKGCSGTILTAIGDDEFKRIILPDLSSNIQNDIKKKITEMYNAKALSKCLFDIAKNGVEMAIEKNEKDAQKWIDAEVKKLGVEL